jgi:hypothetical protein
MKMRRVRVITGIIAIALVILVYLLSPSFDASQVGIVTVLLGIFAGFCLIFAGFCLYRPVCEFKGRYL